jgi:hypothetical protein
MYSVAVNSTFTYTRVDQEGSTGDGYIMVLVCGGSTEPYSTSRLRIFHLGILNVGKELILVGRGLFNWMQTMVCSFTPKITNVMVDYSYDLFDTINAMSLPGGVPDFGGAAGLSAVAMIFNMAFYSQSSSGANAMGNQLEVVLRDVYGNDFGNTSIKLATVSDSICI